MTLLTGLIEPGTAFVDATPSRVRASQISIRMRYVARVERTQGATHVVFLPVKSDPVWTPCACRTYSGMNAAEAKWRGL
jgi:hypothetical protein